MKVDRRDMLKGSAALSFAAMLPSAPARAAFVPAPGKWRDFEVVTRVEISQAEGPAQAWIPVPSVNEYCMTPGVTVCE